MNGKFKVLQLGVGALMLGAASILLMVLGSQASAEQSVNALWFVGLLVIVMAGLTFTAMVFGGLGMANKDEAFGLPSGSVRTLLAIGIMVLLVVFGLNFVRSGTQLFSDVLDIQVPADKLEKESLRYREAGFVPVTVDPGSDVAGTTPAKPAKVRLFRNKLPSEIADLQKQVITAIVTLLTTIVGFYFGSKSSAQRDKGADDAGPTPGPDETQSPGQALKDLSTQRVALIARVKKLETDAAIVGSPPAFVDAVNLAVAARNGILVPDKAAADAMVALSARSSVLSTLDGAATTRPSAESAVQSATSAAHHCIDDLKHALDKLSRLVDAADRLAPK